MEPPIFNNNHQYLSGQIIIFHQPRFPWNKGSHFPSKTLPLGGNRSCEVAMKFDQIYGTTYGIWLVVSTHLKNISQNGNLPQIGVEIKHIWNHHLWNAGYNSIQSPSQRRVFSAWPQPSCGAASWPLLVMAPRGRYTGHHEIWHRDPSKQRFSSGKLDQFFSKNLPYICIVFL